MPYLSIEIYASARLHLKNVIRNLHSLCICVKQKENRWRSARISRNGIMVYNDIFASIRAFKDPSVRRCRAPSRNPPARINVTCDVIVKAEPIRWYGLWHSTSDNQWNVRHARSMYKCVAVYFCVRYSLAGYTCKREEHTGPSNLVPGGVEDIATDPVSVSSFKLKRLTIAICVSIAVRRAIHVAR